MLNQWWLAGEDFADGVSAIVSPTENVSGERRFFKEAQKVTIQLLGAWIRDDKDCWFKGDNDLIFATQHRITTEKNRRPVVDKIHYLRDGVPEFQWIDTLFHPVIYANDDFREDIKEVKIRLRVYDQDGLDEAEIATIDKIIRTASGAAAIAFPAYAPFAGIGAGIASSLTRLIDTLDEHDAIIDAPLTLSVNMPDNKAYKHLQPGFLICFSEMVDAGNLHLREDLKVYDETGNPYTALSYAVLRVSKDCLCGQEILINEKMATLLTELENGKWRASERSPIDFLHDVMNAYATRNKIIRYNELKELDSLTPDQRRLFDELKQDGDLRELIGI